MSAAASRNDPAVVLSVQEMRMAAAVGAERQIQNIFAERQDDPGAPRDGGWQLHLEGAAGEMAFAKWSGRYWSGNVGDMLANDVGRVQIRTAWRQESRLILHKDDPDDRVFVLVTGIAPSFVLRGWIWGRDGKTPGFWTDACGRGRPAYFVPQLLLSPMHVSPRRQAT